MKTTVLLLLIALLTLNGCSIAVNYYIRNLDDELHKITLVGYEKFKGRFGFSYMEGVVEKVKYNTYKEMKQSVVADAAGERVSFSIPPGSTVYIGPGVNSQRIFDKVIIDGDTLDFRGSAIKTSSQVGKSAIWYDIKQ